ncbi:mechanosensitive ion channel family protein [Kordiimonas aquimaris]|uniref:mechanosensitive ion channel family protein n=1 Tax=Kordiimonas aquimaris TaxID=707591 RepID=UPI0021D10B8E|nr:mechanosensitive ion channel domain-containing protein [Kordiimonas aquimaris]
MDFLNDDSINWDELVSQGIDAGLVLLSAFIVLIIGLWLAGFVERRLTALFAKSNKVDATVSSFLSNVGKYVVIIFTGIALLDQFGVETTSLVAILGAAGLAIGLALQGTMSNLAAGVMLLIFRPFKVGNFVEVAGEAGVVHSISLFTTMLDTGDNVRVIIPNNSVWGSSINNYSFHDTRRIQLVFGIGYDDNIDDAMQVIKDVLAADERCLKNPASVVAVTELGDSSVNIMVRVWCASGDYWQLSWDLLKTTKEAFDAKGISIPYPCRSVYNMTA